MNQPSESQQDQVPCVDCDGEPDGCLKCNGKDPDCPSCHGLNKPCRTCGGSGHHVLAQCPRQIVDANTWQLLWLADLAKQGTWPESGGVGDQTESFLGAAQFAWSEDAAMKADRLGTDHPQR